MGFGRNNPRTRVFNVKRKSRTNVNRKSRKSRKN